jgi:transposase-like protein
MKRKRFTEEQIIAVLREQEAGAKVADVCRRHGISDATFYNWKAKYGGMDVSDAKRLKALEEENARLKKLLAEQMLDAAALRELLSKKMVGPAAKRDAVVHLRSAMGLSERRACTIVGADRKMIRYPAGRRRRNCTAGCANSPMSAGASAIGGCSSCSGARANRRVSTASIGSIARKA